MTHMKALVSNRRIVTRFINVLYAKGIGGQGGYVQDDMTIPTISSNEILVKVKAVALNPTDFKHLDVISPPNSIIGCDYAGVIHQVGDSVKDKWNVGDRVAGAVHGGLYPDKGAFAEYLKTDADVAWKVPDGISDTDAATYGVSAVTAMLTLNVHHGLPFVDTKSGAPKDEAVFIYAGATSAGLYHIQVAKAAGYKVVTTASPRSFQLVKDYGADAVFDYKSPSVAADIIKEYPKITKAVDCFSEGKSTSICAAVLKPTGGKVITLLPNGKSGTPGVTYDTVMSYTAFGHPFQWLPPIGPKFEARPQDRAALVRFYTILPQITHLLKPIPTIKMKNGFDGVLEGLNKLRAGQVSGVSNKIIPLTIIKGAGHEHIPIPEGDCAIIADFHTIQTKTKASPAYLTTGFYRVVPGPTRYGEYDYEETKYVLRGQIDVTDEATGITHHLVAGDWAFFHVGSKAQFSTKSEGLAFYAVTRAANNTPHINLKGREESTSKL
ncbi:hypothetical protein ACHAPA_012229 [Fusarium lateritium]